jgi:CYTH domain-containing protein
MEEFELTYLPKKEFLKNLEGLSFKEMIDIYIPVLAHHPTLRIRKSGEKYEITKKQPVKEGDSSHQLETTIPLTTEEYADLNKLKGKRIFKNRYLYKEGGYTYEVDVFQGALKGLVVVDVEFKSNEEKSKFKTPSWALADITHEKFMAGGILAGKSYSDIQKDLERLGYQMEILK